MRDWDFEGMRAAAVSEMECSAAALMSVPLESRQPLLCALVLMWAAGPSLLMMVRQLWVPRFRLRTYLDDLENEVSNIRSKPADIYGVVDRVYARVAAAIPERLAGFPDNNQRRQDLAMIHGTSGEAPMTRDEPLARLTLAAEMLAERVVDAAGSAHDLAQATTMYAYICKALEEDEPTTYGT